MEPCTCAPYWYAVDRMKKSVWIVLHGEILIERTLLFESARIYSCSGYREKNPRGHFFPFRSHNRFMQLRPLNARSMVCEVCETRSTRAGRRYCSNRCAGIAHMAVRNTQKRKRGDAAASFTFHISWFATPRAAARGASGRSRDGGAAR